MANKEKTQNNLILHLKVGEMWINQRPIFNFSSKAPELQVTKRYVVHA